MPAVWQHALVMTVEMSNMQVNTSNLSPGSWGQYVSAVLNTATATPPATRLAPGVTEDQVAILTCHNIKRMCTSLSASAILTIKHHCGCSLASGV